MRWLGCFEVQLPALRPFHIEKVCLLAYEVHQHQQPFGIHVDGSPVYKQFVSVKFCQVVVRDECAQQIQVCPLAFDVTRHLIAHTVLLGYTGIQPLPNLEQRLTVGQWACQAPHAIMTRRTILW